AAVYAGADGVNSGAGASWLGSARFRSRRKTQQRCAAMRAYACALACGVSCGISTFPKFPHAKSRCVRLTQFACGVTTGCVRGVRIERASGGTANASLTSCAGHAREEQIRPSSERYGVATRRKARPGFAALDEARQRCLAESGEATSDRHAFSVAACFSRASG